VRLPKRLWSSTEIVACATISLTDRHSFSIPGGCEPLRVTGAVVYTAGVDGWRIAIDREQAPAMKEHEHCA
jgi:hypothetical protein